MLVLTWGLNSTTGAAIQLFLLNEFVNRSRISQLEYISDKTGYLLTLDFFSTSSIVNRGVAHDSTCMFGAMFKKILVTVRLFSLTN